MPLFNVNGKRVLFLHVPKSGGTTVGKLFAAYPMSFFSQISPGGLKCTPQHLVFTDLRVLLGESGWDYAFTIVRNPYRRAESEFRFRTEINQGRYGARPDFSLWLNTQMSAYRNNPFVLDNHMRHQIGFAGPGVEVFKLEEGLETITRKLSEKLSIKLNYGGEQINKSTVEVDLVWDPETLTQFNEIYAADFRTFGYEKRSTGSVLI